MLSDKMFCYKLDIFSLRRVETFKVIDLMLEYNAGGVQVPEYAEDTLTHIFPVETSGRKNDTVKMGISEQRIYIVKSISIFVCKMSGFVIVDACDHHSIIAVTANSIRYAVNELIIH